VLRRITPRAAPYFVFGDPVAFAAEATLDPGWQLRPPQQPRGRPAASTPSGVMITAARGRIDIEGMDFLAHDARVELGDNFARGTYWMNFTTTDYRMRLDGRLRPPEINGWFPRRLVVGFLGTPTSPSRSRRRRRKSTCKAAGVTPSRTVYFGRAQAREATVWGGDSSSRRTPDFHPAPFRAWAGAHCKAAPDGAQHVTGTFKRFHPTRSGSILILRRTPDPAVLGRMLAGQADEVLASLRFTRASARPRAGHPRRGQQLHVHRLGRVTRSIISASPLDSAPRHRRSHRA
jgi:hypothetical protein